MATPLHHYSRLVFWLKITLPILALVVLSTLFLFARRIDIEGALPYAQVELERLAQDPRLTAPEYAGVTDDGTSVRVAASGAQPGKDGSGPTTVSDVVALYESASGGRISVSAESGLFDTDDQLLRLTGNVVVATADGYQLRSEQMSTSLRETLVTADGAVRALTPLGTVEAGAMQLTGPVAAHLLVFKKGVRLVYKPQS